MYDLSISIMTQGNFDEESDMVAGTGRKVAMAKLGSFSFRMLIKRHQPAPRWRVLITVLSPLGTDCDFIFDIIEVITRFVVSVQLRLHLLPT